MGSHYRGRRSSFDHYDGCASDHGSTNDDGGHRSTCNYNHGCAGHHGSTNDDGGHGSTNDDGGHRSSRNYEHGCASDHGSTNDHRSYRQHHGHTLGYNIRRVALVDVPRWLEAVSHVVRSFVLIIQSVSLEHRLCVFAVTDTVANSTRNFRSSLFLLLLL